MRSDVDWVLRQLGPAAELVSVRRIHHNGHVALHSIVANNRGVRRKLILRRYIDREWVAREPDLASREAKTLQLLEHDAGFRTPRLVAVDPTGRETSAPAVLMSHLGGREEWKPPSIEQFAELAPRIHRVRAPRTFRRYERYYSGAALVMPPWTKQPKLWERAFEVAEAATVDESTACFIHRDHHPGNVLWSRGRVSGVVDWIEACVGPTAVDAARCRMNLWRHAGPDAAAQYARCDGVVVDPLWDVVDSIDTIADGMLPGPDAEALEGFLFAALAELG